MPTRLSSWGGMSNAVQSWSQPLFSSDIGACLAATRHHPAAKFLVIGNLRSYGDEVLSLEGNYIQTTRCDRIISIDRDSDTVTVESGLTIDALQRRLLPLGYVVPVTPGTAFLTVGGAIANDVHGKNHHVAGTFGRYVERFELLRSTGEALICSRDDNEDQFAATIGGMGLTGAITWATIKLRPLNSPWLRIRSERFDNLDDFFRMDELARGLHEYTVAWIDCLARGKSVGRGIYSVADHVSEGGADTKTPRETPTYRASVPFGLPVSPVNRVTLTVMNSLYWRLHRIGSRRVHFMNWLYPLDSIKYWNRLYGPRGFRQFQCVVPPFRARDAVAEMLETAAALGQGSFLAVLKNFGEQPSPGLMSFPMLGTTLALDFANRGDATVDLLLALHRITAAAGGRLYAAKDGCSPSDSLENGYPNFTRFKRLIDPGIASSLALRLRLLN